MAHHAHSLLGSYATPLFRYGQVVPCAIRGDAPIVLLLLPFTAPAGDSAVNRRGEGASPGAVAGPRPAP